ncbi:MAG: hypothetical protein GQ570_11655 [Helicobacteraceae bacterium]|nr:hypothetical protein [Helicobacteraceae bacterium]
MAKTKKYFWLKQKIDFFQDVRIKKLRKIAGGDTYVIIFQKIMLLSVPTDGIITFDEVEESLAEELSLILDEDVINVQVTIDFMAKHKMIEELDKNQYIINSVLTLIGSETASAERVRNHRAKKELQCNIDVIECNDEVTDCNTEKRRDREEIEKIESKNIITSKSYDDSFRLAEYLLNHILKINPNHKKPNLDKWAKDIDLAIRVDGRTVEQLRDCIKWIHSTEDGMFWRKNVLSGSALRNKFDTMNMQVIAKKPTAKEKKLSQAQQTTYNFMIKKGYSKEDIAIEIGKIK